MKLKLPLMMKKKTVMINIFEERYIQMGASEQFILTLSENGFGKRSSSHEYRVSGRGGKGFAH